MSDLDILRTKLTKIAQATQSGAYVAVRGYGSGGWYAGCKLGEEHLSEDASGPLQAVSNLADALEERLRSKLAAAEADATRLRAQLEGMDS